MVGKHWKVSCFFIISFCVACSSSKNEHSETPSVPLPNIVLIYADDMGYGEIQALNPDRSKVPTPNLNRLAQEGMVFTDAHTTSSVCTPSRYSLLTGRYNWRSRLQHGVVTGGHEPLIASNRLTLPQVLKNKGYNTAMVGKWHLEYLYEVPSDLQDVQLSERTNKFMPAPYPIGTKIVHGPIARGFDTYYGFHHSREMSSMVRNDVIEAEIAVDDVLPSLTEEVVKLIDQKAELSKQGNPFFIYFAQNSPHTPIAPSISWQGKTELGPYGDFVAQTDGSVGAVLEALDKNGIAENTLLVFSADNGTSKAANIEYLQANGHFPSAQYRGSKADLWDGGHRVPFIIRWPGKVTPGTKTSQLICLSDIMATFADLVSEELPENTAEDSWSFLPLLHGHDLDQARKNIVHHSLFGRFSIREDNWKLILAPGSGGWSTPNDIVATKQGLPEIQLYDLAADIMESDNLITTHPDKVDHLIVLLQEIVRNGRSTPGPNLENDAEIDIFKVNWNFANRSGYQ